MIFLYYSGYKPSWSRYSVGMLTAAEILKDAVTRGVTRVEFLRGANEYKSRWGSSARVETDCVLGRRRHLVRAQEGYARRRKALWRRVIRWRTRLQRVVISALPQF